MKDPLVQNVRVPLFMRGEHRDMLRLAMMEFTGALNDGSIRVYASPNFIPSEIVGIVKKIQIDENGADDYIEFDVTDTEYGRMIGSLYNVKIPLYVSAVYLWDTCHIIATHLMGFNIHVAQPEEYLYDDEEKQKFLRHVVPAGVFLENSQPTYEGGWTK